MRVLPRGLRRVREERSAHYETRVLPIAEAGSPGIPVSSGSSSWLMRCFPDLLLGHQLVSGPEIAVAQRGVRLLERERRAGGAVQQVVEARLVEGVAVGHQPARLLVRGRAQE